MKIAIEMARTVGATAYTNRHYLDRPTHTFNVDQLERFAELVRADERARMAEQPAQQEPVALMQEIDVLMLADSHGIDPSTKGLYNFYVDCISTSPLAQQEPVFTYDQVKAHIQAAMMSAAQRTWVGLSDLNIDELENNYMKSAQTAHEFLRAIEAKLKEKNT